MCLSDNKNRVRVRGYGITTLRCVLMNKPNASTNKLKGEWIQERLPLADGNIFSSIGYF